MYMQGETIPKEANHVRLHESKTDQWGIPLLVTSVGYDDNDDKMIRDWRAEAKAMLEVAGCHNEGDPRQRTGARSRHSRNGRLPHGQRSETVDAQQLKSDARLSERFRHRWGVHDFHRQSESVDFVYGADGSRGESRRR